MDLLDSSCLLCSNESESKASWEGAWGKKCAESVCKLLDFEGELFQPFFEAAEYCRSCKGLLRDVDFMMRCQEVLQRRISAARIKLSTLLHRRLEMTFASENMADRLLSELFSSTAVKLEGEAETTVRENSPTDCLVELMGTQSSSYDDDVEPEPAYIPAIVVEKSETLMRPRRGGNVNKKTTNSRRFECSLCQVSFPTLVKLKRHKATGRHRRNITVKNTPPYTVERVHRGTEVEVADEYTKPEPIVRRSLRNIVSSMVVVKYSDDENDEEEEIGEDDSNSSFDVETRSVHDETEDSEISEEERKEELNSETEQLRVGEPHKPFSCSICLGVFRNRMNTLAHKRRHGLVPELGCAFYGCRNSQYQFQSLEELRNHVAELHITKLKEMKTYHNKLKRVRKATIRNAIKVENSEEWRINKTGDSFLETLDFVSLLEMNATKALKEPFPYQCPLCDDIFATGPRLDHHIIRAHEGVRKALFCPVSTCLRRFVFGRQSTTRKQALDQHLRTAHGEFIPQLHDEEEVRKNKVRKRENKRRTSFFCQVEGCNRRSTSAAMLEAHRLEVHEGVLEAYPCPDCGEKFRNNRALHKHRSKLNTHGSGVLCEHCGYSTSTGYQLRKHIKNKHKHVRFSCSLCHLMLFVKEDVSQHEALHSKAAALTCVALSCICKDTEFENVDKLRSHVARMHDPMKKEMICDICGHVSRGDGVAYRFKVHKRSHTLEKEFQCRFCERKFAGRHQRLSHEEINHQEQIGVKRVYACNLCDETFSARQYLYKHRSWHKHGSNANLPKARQKKS